MTRPEWDETFSKVAHIMSERSTCSRRKVGAVLVRDNRIVATGYNGQPSGKTHCVDGGCPRGKFTHDEIPKDADYNQFPCTAIHAEANAIIRAGHALTEGATIYVTELPCQQCSNLIEGAGIIRVFIG
jgi:dCMP deaminase